MFGISYLKLAAAGVVIALLTFTHIYVYMQGKQAVLDKLAADRITILKDGKEIDNEVLSADDDALCRLLGGCLPDQP